MKALKLFTLLVPTALLAVSCGTSSRLGGSSSGDDIYYNPADDAKEHVVSASNGKRVPLDKSYSDLINETNSALNDTIYVSSDSTGNPYQDVLADSYEKAKRNRELGYKDPWYGMPNSTVGYSQNMWYATAYDPAFYNIIVMGNTVWAEPKYVSSMFGYPYHSSYVNYGPYYSPYRNYWNLSFGMGFGLGWGWSTNWGWGYDPYWDSPYCWSTPYYHHHNPYYYSNSYYSRHYSYPSSRYREGAYGPREGGVRYDYSSARRYPSSTGYSNSSYSRGYSSARPRNAESSYNMDARSSSARQTQGAPSYSSRDYQSTPGRRVSTSAPARMPSREAYTPTYNRPSRSSGAVFNDGGSVGSSRSYDRRPSNVVVPRTDRSSSYDNSSRSYPTRTYTPTRSNDYNSGSSYSSPSRSNSSSSSSNSSSSSSRNDNNSGSSSRGRR